MWMKTGRQFASAKESIPDQPVKVSCVWFLSRLVLGLVICYAKRHYASAQCLELTPDRAIINFEAI